MSEIFFFWHYGHFKQQVLVFRPGLAITRSQKPTTNSAEIVRRLVMPHELILGFFLHHICSRQIFCLSSCVTRWRSTDTSISVMAFEHPLTPSPTSMIDTQWRHYLGTDSRLLIILDCTQTCVAVLLRFKTFSICYGFGLSNVNWIPSTEDISLSHKYSRKMFWPLIVSVTKYFRRMCSA